MAIAAVSEAAILNLIFCAQGWTGYADNTATSPQTNIAVALHTADPGSSGNQSTNETSYTGYARGAVARTTSGWTVSGSNPTVCALAAALTFSACTGGTASLGFFSTGKTGGGTTPILFSGAVSPAISVSSGVTPQLSSATTISLL